MQHDLKGNMVLLKSLPLISKVKEKQQRASIRPSEEEYFHQCQRGKFLEMLSLMAKELAKIGVASKLSIRQKRQGNRLKDKLNIWSRFVYVK